MRGREEGEGGDNRGGGRKGREGIIGVRGREEGEGGDNRGEGGGREGIIGVRGSTSTCEYTLSYCPIRAGRGPLRNIQSQWRQPSRTAQNLWRHILLKLNWR